MNMKKLRKILSKPKPKNVKQQQTTTKQNNNKKQEIKPEPTECRSGNALKFINTVYSYSVLCTEIITPRSKLHFQYAWFDHGISLTIIFE